MKNSKEILNLKQCCFQTRRLILRPWEDTLSDARDMFEYARRPNVGPNAGWRPHETIEDTKKVIRKFINDRKDFTWALVLKDTNKAIGSMGLHNRSPRRSLFRRDEREIGYVLNPDYWGNGYVPEAVSRLLQVCFYDLRLDGVWCGHYEHNKQSRRVIEKCGFSPVFKREEVMFHSNNELVWAYYYKWTRKDYLEFFGETPPVEHDNDIRTGV